MAKLKFTTNTHGSFEEEIDPRSSAEWEQDQRREHLDRQTRIQQRIAKAEAAKDKRSVDEKELDWYKEQLDVAIDEGSQASQKYWRDVIKEQEAKLGEIRRKEQILADPKNRNAFEMLDLVGHEFDDDLRAKIEDEVEVLKEVGDTDAFWKEVVGIRDEQNARIEDQAKTLKDEAAGHETERLKVEKDMSLLRVRQVKLEQANEQRSD